ncbi:MAG: hypothetical protein FJ147_21860 [Deltaproteobacteria bacterium]|nr:hypothetical protein [Deltaproteobacteria bacterium]
MRTFRPDSKQQFTREDPIEFREYEPDAAKRGRLNQQRGKRFEDEVATLYRLLGFEVKQDLQLSGMQVDLQIEKREGGLRTQAIIECKDKRITATERDQILAQQNITQKKLPKHRWIAVSSQGFAADTRTALDEGGIDCTTYPELLAELVPLSSYVEHLINDYKAQTNKHWEGQDWFIRPNLVTDVTYEKQVAIPHFAKWLGDTRSNFLVVLGDLGTGKSTLAGFLAYNLARSFRDDPLRHPAPVLIPLKEVRKEVSLSGIIVKHFADRNLSLAFPRFEHLVHLGKIILFFDAFDEMADRVRWEVTRSNFHELRRAAEQSGKVILTCRTHYFKDRNEQVRLIDRGPRLSQVETDLYRELKQQSGAEVVYLQEFDDTQIQEYLRKARAQTFKDDWQTIQKIHNLQELAHRPLLLDMIVKSLPKLVDDQRINAANLYTVYTNFWVDREETKGRILDKTLKLQLMLELAWRMWHEEKDSIHYKELVPFVEKLAANKSIDFGVEEVEDIAREMQAATFLKRDDNGNFSFVHRSFMEFFLARKILDDLSRRQTQVLNTRRFDRKVIYFLTLLDERQTTVAPLQTILTTSYTLNLSENALQILYWSGRISCGMEEKIDNVETLQNIFAQRIPACLELTGAKLQEIVLEGADLLDSNLNGADLTKANLNQTLIIGTHCQHAILQDARLERAVIEHVDFRHGQLRGISLTGSQLTNCDFTDATINSASITSAQIEKCVGLASRNTFSHNTVQPVVQRHHALSVTTIAYSPGCELLAAASNDGIIRLYRTSDYQLLHALQGHQNSIQAITFTPDGQTLASASDDTTIRLWEVSSGKELCILQGHQNSVQAITFTPDGQTLASASDDTTIRLWAVSSGKELCILQGHQHPVSSVAFASDGQILASAGADKSICLWTVRTSQVLHILKGHQNSVTSVAFAPDGQTLASASDDASIRLWAVSTGKELRILRGHQDSVRSIAFAPDGQTLASASDDASIRLWAVSTGKELRILRGHQDSVRSIAFAPDGQTLASASADYSVRLWAVNTDEESRILQGHQDSIRSVVFAPDGQTLASASADTSVRLWAVSSGKELYVLQGHRNIVWSIAFASDGLILASSGDDYSVRLWAVNTGQELRVLQGHKNWVRSVAFTPIGQTLASGSSDHSVRLWTVENGKSEAVLAGHLGPVYSVQFAPNGKYLVAAGAAGRLQFWDVTSCATFLYRYSFGPGAWLDLLPDGRFDASPEGMRYLRYTEDETLNSYAAEDLVKEFYRPKEVEAEIERYTK